MACGFCDTLADLVLQNPPNSEFEVTLDWTYGDLLQNVGCCTCRDTVQYFKARTSPYTTGTYSSARHKMRLCRDTINGYSRLEALDSFPIRREQIKVESDMANEIGIVANSDWIDISCIQR
jgi:hypothetical protein